MDTIKIELSKEMFDIFIGNKRAEHDLKKASSTAELSRLLGVKDRLISAASKEIEVLRKENIKLRSELAELSDKALAFMHQRDECYRNMNGYRGRGGC